MTTEMAAVSDGENAPIATMPTGQLAKVADALSALAAARVPLSALKPGQLYRRVNDQLRATGIVPNELPSRSTFERFRRGFGQRFGLK